MLYGALKHNEYLNEQAIKKRKNRKQRKIREFRFLCIFSCLPAQIRSRNVNTKHLYYLHMFKNHSEETYKELKNRTLLFL